MKGGDEFNFNISYDCTKLSKNLRHFIISSTFPPFNLIFQRHYLF